MTMSFAFSSMSCILLNSTVIPLHSTSFCKEGLRAAIGCLLKEKSSRYCTIHAAYLVNSWIDSWTVFCPCSIVSNLFDTCLCIKEFKNLFCNPLITDSSDQSLIGCSGHSTFLVNHLLVLPLSHIPKNCTWVLVQLTPKRPCSLSHCIIPATNVLYTLRSELPEYSSGGLIFSLIHVMIDLSGLLSQLSSNVLHTMHIIGSWYSWSPVGYTEAVSASGDQYLLVSGTITVRRLCAAGADTRPNEREGKTLSHSL